MQDNYQNRLYMQEWMVIAFFVVLMVLLTLATHSCDSHSMDAYGASKDQLSPHHIVSPEIEVFVEGEVEFPGRHLVKRDAKVKELLLLSKPFADADLSSIKLEGKLKKGQILKIPPKKTIKIFLKSEGGSLEELTVLQGTRVEELTSTGVFKEELLIPKKRKSRLLKDGEVVKKRI